MRKNANPDDIDRLDPIHLQRTGAAVKRYIKVHEAKTGRVVLIVRSNRQTYRPHGISLRDLKYAANHVKGAFGFTPNTMADYFASVMVVA